MLINWINFEFLETTIDLHNIILPLSISIIYIIEGLLQKDVIEKKLTLNRQLNRLVSLFLQRG